MNLTPGQLARIGQLSDQWSFLWDKRRLLWIAAEDCLDGEQIEEPDLDALLARLPGTVAARSYLVRGDADPEARCLRARLQEPARDR